ncbi:hypothetical protein ABPG72_002345 [Tetrahymena utriculariae]
MSLFECYSSKSKHASSNYNDSKFGQSSNKSQKRRPRGSQFKNYLCQEIEVLVQEQDFESILKELLYNYSTNKKDIAIKILNFHGNFKIDLWFSLEQVMRELNNITTITFQNCKLTKEHLKVLKGQILFHSKCLRIIFSFNNLSDLEMDYFIFGNNEVICKRIQDGYLYLYIVNNYGVFKEQFIQKIQTKLSDCVLVYQDQGLIQFNTNGKDDLEYNSHQFFRLSCMKCIRQSIHQFADENIVSDNKVNPKKQKSLFQKGISDENQYVDFLKQLEEEQELQENNDEQDDNPQRCLEAIIDSLLPSDQLNPVEKLDLGYLFIRNTNLLKKLWTEIASCSSIRLLYLHHLEDYIIDSLAVNISKRKFHVQKVEFTQSKIKPESFRYIMRNISAEKLVLADCGLTNEHFEDMEIVLKSNKRILRYLKHFDISKNAGVEKEGMKHLGEYLKKFENLKILIMNNCELNDDKISKLTLESNDVNQNEQIYSLFKCLEILEIKGNKDITSVGYSKLFKWLCKFQKFKSIDLQENKINSDILNEFALQHQFFLKIKKIDLSKNSDFDGQSLEKFIEMLSESNTLTHLSLEDCQLGNEIVINISQLLLNIKSNVQQSLKLLNISNNKFCRQDSHFMLASFLMKCTKLKYLNLSNVNINNENYESLGNLLDSNMNFLQNLKELNLSNNSEISEDGWDLIFSKLKDEENLRKLDLSKCQLGPRVCKKIYAQFGKSCSLYKSVTHLNISQNFEIKEGWEFLAQCLRYFDRLNILDLSETIYSDKDLKFMENAFQPTMMVLKSPSNRNDKDSIASSEVIVQYPLIKSLKTFNFSNNPSPKKGWDSFWKILSQFESLIELNITSCFLQDDKVKNIVLLTYNAHFFKTLKILILFGNSFLNLIGWICLFDCIKKCEKLEKLDLSFCYLTNKKLIAISKLLTKSQPNITPNSQSQNKLTEEFLKNSSLRNVILDGNDKIGPIGYKKLLQALTGRIVQKQIQFENLKSSAKADHLQERNNEEIKDHLFTLNKLPQELQKLHLNKNIKMTPQELGYLFRQISMFQNIKEISLQHCYLNDKKIDSILNQLQREASKPLKYSLQSLDLSGNQKISYSAWLKLFQTLSSCINFSKIYMRNCNLGEQQIRSIAEVLQEKENLLKNLTDFDLGWNRKMTSKGLQMLFEVLSKSYLQYLSLQNCQLDDQKFKPLINALKKSQLSKNLHTLDLSMNPKISPLNWKLFFQNLNNMEQISNLYFQHNKLNSERLTFFQSELNNPKSQVGDRIRCIELLGSNKVKDTIWEQLFKAFKNCTFLESLGLEFCNLNEKVCQIMNREFTSEQSQLTNSLRNLSLQGNDLISQEGWSNVFQTVALMKGLQNFNISICELTDQKVSSIEDNIKKEHPITFTLQKISLSFNAKITNQGWSCIFKCISNFKKLEGIQLTKCGLNDDILSTMILNLKAKDLVGKSLKKLIINNNSNIQKQGYINLIFFLKNDCKSINSVKIDENGIDQENLQDIVTQITGKTVKTKQKKKSLVDFSDQLNNIKKDQKIQDIVQGLIQNIQLQKQNSKQINFMKKFTIQMTVKDTKFSVLEDLPKSLSQAVYKLNKYFLESRNLRIEKNALQNGIIYNLGNFPIEMIGEHFIKYIVEDKNILCFTTKGLRSLSKIFAYNLPQNEIEPYPYRIILNSYNLKYFTNHIKEIYILNNSFDSDVEQLAYPFLKEVYQNFHDSGINQIHLQYTLSSSFMESIMLEGGEKYLNQFISLLPPKKIEFYQKITLPCWKSIYSKLYHSYDLQYVNMSYDINSVSNVGIAFAWREHIYYNYKPTTYIGSKIKQLIYYILSIFVTESIKYKYKKRIQKLNDRLKNKDSILYFLLILTFIYYLVAIGAPFLVTYKDIDNKSLSGGNSNSEVCEKGVNVIALIIYFAFALVSAIIELYLFIYVYKKVGKLLPDPVEVNEEDKKKVQSKLEQLIFKVKKIIKGKKKFLIGVALVQSQLTKYHLYNEACFAIVCFACGYHPIGSLMASIIAGNLLVSAFNFIKIIKHIRHKSSRLYTTSSLNKFYEITTLLECAALSSLLDFVAPFNVWIVPNNCMTRYLLPNLAGKSISNKIFKSCIKFVFEDTPQLVLSLMFVILRSGNQVNQNAIIAMIMSAISLGVSTYNFLSIRPSTISQLDFNQLVEKQSETYIQKAYDTIAMESKQIAEWRNHYLENKAISLDLIPQETAEAISMPLQITSEFKFLTNRNY